MNRMTSHCEDSYEAFGFRKNKKLEEPIESCYLGHVCNTLMEVSAL
jgi:hypothetical protein